MPYSNVKATLTTTQKAAIKNAINTLITNLPFLISLTPEERISMVKMGDKSLAFVEKVAEYSESAPQFNPPHMSKTEFKQDIALQQDLEQILRQLVPLVESIQHTELALGSECMEYARGYFSILGFAKTTNAPGAEAIHTDVAARYPHTGPGPVEKDAPPTA